MDSKMKKNILNGLTVLCFIVVLFFFFATPAPDEMCDEYMTPECEEVTKQQDRGYGICCTTFILMFVFGFWAKKLQDAEKLEENLLMAKSMQEAESERLKLESERFRLAQEAEQNRIESAKEAEKMRLRKEIEELEKGLDD